MTKTNHAASPFQLFDVTEVASLRRRLAHAASALRFIGVISGFISSSFSSVLGIVVTLLIPACAFLIAKRLKSGRTWPR